MRIPVTSKGAGAAAYPLGVGLASTFGAGAGAGGVLGCSIMGAGAGAAFLASIDGFPPTSSLAICFFAQPDEMKPIATMEIGTNNQIDDFFTIIYFSFL
jgi:hypothetical protein